MASHQSRISLTDVELLQVDTQFDKDFDHFPDVLTWPAAVPAAQARYQGHPELLDCVDSDPGASEPPLPVPYYAVQINPLAKPSSTSPKTFARNSETDLRAWNLELLWNLEFGACRFPLQLLLWVISAIVHPLIACEACS